MNGKRRMCTRPKKLDKKKWSAPRKKTPYARHGQSRSAKRLQTFSEKQIIAEMTTAGFLKDWPEYACPHCGVGEVFAA
eukprot:3791536-Pyramimonas_sp.AAC.1